MDTITDSSDYYLMKPSFSNGRKINRLQIILVSCCLALIVALLTRGPECFNIALSIPLPLIGGRFSIIDTIILLFILIGMRNFFLGHLNPELRRLRRIFIAGVGLIGYGIIIGGLHGAKFYYLGVDIRCALGFLAGIGLYSCLYSLGRLAHILLVIFAACNLATASYMIIFKAIIMSQQVYVLTYRAVDSSIMWAYGAGAVLMPMLFYYSLFSRKISGMIGLLLIAIAILSIGFLANIRSALLTGAIGIMLMIYSSLPSLFTMQEQKMRATITKSRIILKIIFSLVCAIFIIFLIQGTDLFKFYDTFLIRLTELQYPAEQYRLIELKEMFSQLTDIDYFVGKGFGVTYHATTLASGSALIPHINAFVFLLKFGLIGQILFFYYLAKLTTRIGSLPWGSKIQLAPRDISAVTLYSWLIGSFLSGVFNPIMNILIGYLVADSHRKRAKVGEGLIQ